MPEGSVQSEATGLAALTWAQRAQAELGAERRFRQLALDMSQQGINSNIIALAVSAAKDEQNHAQLCSSVAKSFGHETGFEFFSGHSLKTECPWGDLSAYQKLACELILMCCITESINASLLNTISAAISDTSRPGRIIRGILNDEVKHAQIGWAFLASLPDKSAMSIVGAYLPDMLNLAVKDELFLPHTAADPDLYVINQGVLPVSQRLEQFTTTLERLVLPGLARFGIDIDAAKDWLAKKAGHVS